MPARPGMVAAALIQTSTRQITGTELRQVSLMRLTERLRRFSARVGSAANLNVSAYFNSLTFNRNDSAGFTVGGGQTLSVLRSTSGGTANLTVGDTAGNGITTISAPFQVNTSSGGTSLLTIRNDEAGTSGASLVFSNTLSASTPANVFGLRFAGSGSTTISGAISNISGIQQGLISGANMSGTVTIAGNQSLGSAAVQIVGIGSGTGCIHRHYSNGRNDH